MNYSFPPHIYLLYYQIQLSKQASKLLSWSQNFGLPQALHCTALVVTRFIIIFTLWIWSLRNFIMRQKGWEIDLPLWELISLCSKRAWGQLRTIFGTTKITPFLQKVYSPNYKIHWSPLLVSKLLSLCSHFSLCIKENFYLSTYLKFFSLILVE